MTCIAYKVLVTEWMMLLYKNHAEPAIVAAYWKAVEHRSACEACRDETQMNGCSPLYDVVSSHKEPA
ncbi:MAG TPA: hypothetical protein VGI45_24830 [Terracidiphilus sp.]|jgi:hypothetical protein